MRGLLHCVADDEPVRGFGRDDDEFLIVRDVLQGVVDADYDS
jgi:hypothetical protein